MNRRPFSPPARGLAAGAVLWLGAALAAPGAPAPPEARVGPYRVVIDRITHNHTLGINYLADPARRDENRIDSRRTLQVQVAVFAADAPAAAGLATFAVNGVTAESGRRIVDLAHYGGMLESPNDTAVVRAYLYVPTFPPLAREIRAVEGQIIAYEKSAPLEIEIPLESGRVPVTVEKDGVRATVRELITDGSTMQVVLWLEGPAPSVLMNTAGDGSCGMAVLNLDGRPAALVGGTLINPRPNQGEYRVSFQTTRMAAAKIRLRVLHRGGERHVYPFRIEHVPVPSRTGNAPDAGGEKPGQKGG